MKHSNFIRKAKKHLAKNLDELNYKESHVCCALSDAVTNYKQAKTSQEIQDLIAERIHPYYTITAWVFHNIKNVDLDKISYDQFQDYRSRWMDSLAEEYERAGK